MDNRTKLALCLAGALLCIGAAGALVHTFSGSWDDEAPTALAGPALNLREGRPLEAPSQRQAKRYAYITGAVQNAGVYPIGEDARVFNLVDAAGGLAYDADTSQLNLAAPLRDGAHIHVKAISSSGSSGKKGTNASGKNAKAASTGIAQFVNVNTATEEELRSLPGIGSYLAKKIIAYRQEHGFFDSAESLLGVSGIGRAKLGAIRPLLRF